MIIEFLKEEKCNEMFNLIKDCFNLEVNDNNIKEIIKSENCKAIIMTNKDELIGTAIIDILNDYIKNQKYYLISSLYQRLQHYSHLSHRELSKHLCFLYYLISTKCREASPRCFRVGFA